MLKNYDGRCFEECGPSTVLNTTQICEYCEDSEYINNESKCSKCPKGCTLCTLNKVPGTENEEVTCLDKRVLELEYFEFNPKSKSIELKFSLKISKKNLEKLNFKLKNKPLNSNNTKIVDD